VFEDGTALCSCSEVRMKTVSREGVTVDVCPECNAVWFDAGELERVVAENRKKFVATFQAARPSVTPASTLVLDALGSLVETIGGMLFRYR